MEHVVIKNAGLPITNRGSTCPNTESDVRLAVVPEGVCLGWLCCATAEPFVGEANQNAP